MFQQLLLLFLFFPRAIFIKCFYDESELLGITPVATETNTDSQYCVKLVADGTFGTIDSRLTVFSSDHSNICKKSECRKSNSIEICCCSTDFCNASPTPLLFFPLPLCIILFLR